MTDMSEVESSDSTLATTAPDYKSIGEAIIAKAKDEQRQDAQDAVIRDVQNIMVAMARRKDALREFTRETEKYIAQQQARLDAIEAGAFTLDLVKGLRYNDNELNGGGL